MTPPNLAYLDSYWRYDDQKECSYDELDPWERQIRLAQTEAESKLKELNENNTID